MGRAWTQVTDVKSFLSARGNVRTGSHRMTGKTLHWPYCVQCGLVWLKNDVTRRAMKSPCVWEDD